MSYKNRREEKEKLILKFLKSEGFSTRKILGELLKVSRTSISRTLKSLERRGLLMESDVNFCFDQRSPSLWGLTPTGAFEATEDGKYRHFDPNKVSEITIRHELAIQSTKIKAIHLGWNEWLGGRELRKLAVAERKLKNAGGINSLVWLQIPDAFAVSPKGRKIAFEIERTIKTSERYEEIFKSYCQMLIDGTVQEVVYVCPEDKCVRLERLILSIETVLIGGLIRPVNDSFRKRFHFVTYEEWEDYAKNF